MHTRPQRTNQNTHHDRTTGNTQTHRSRHSRNIQRNGSYGKTENDSEEDSAEVRLVQGLYGITQKLFYMVDTRRVANYSQPVAVLQTEVICSKQTDITTKHSTHIHAIGISHLQTAQALTVQSRTGNNDNAAFYLRINRIPVYLIIIPLLIHLLSEENLHRRDLFLIGNHEHIIIRMKNRISLRNYHLFASPHTGDDELAMRHHRNLCYGIAVQGRIHDYILSDSRMVVIIIIANLQIFRFHKEFAQEHHRQDNAHNTQRISNGTAQSCTFARQAQLLQRLLGSTKGRRIGCGSTQDTHHIRQTDWQNPAQAEREQGSHQDDSQTPEIERNAFVTHRTEEVRTHIKTQHIHKHGKAEAFCKLQHVLVNREP